MNIVKVQHMVRFDTKLRCLAQPTSNYFKPIRIRWYIITASHQRHTFTYRHLDVTVALREKTNASAYLSLCISQLNHFSVAWPHLDLILKNYSSSPALSSHHVLCSINIRNLLTLFLHDLGVRTATRSPSNTQ